MKRFFLLGFIVFIAFFLRFWQLGQNPPSLTWDEAAWGYNAYALGFDGRDEFGRFLPHDYLESFGDFKPPVYAYLDIIPIKIFGLTEFATRFPSALLGSLTVILTFYLVIAIFKDSEKKLIDENILAFFSALSLAISPWHINLSRAAFEANVSTFFLVLGVYCFVLFTQKKNYYLFFSAVSFVLSLYTFNTARVVAPLLIIALAIGYRKSLLAHKKQVIFAGFVGLVLLLPTLRFLLSPQANLRFREVNIFSDVTVVQRVNQEIENDGNASWSKIIHNRRFAYTMEYLHHYFDNLNPSFLFIKGDGNPKFSTQTVGQLYVWDLPFLLIGIFVLFRLRQGTWWILPVWVLLGIVPAATARETPHALRIETIIPTLQIIVAYGFLYSLIKMKSYKKSLEKPFYVVCIVFLMFNFLYYFHDYYAHYPYDYSGEWQYGYKQSIAYADSVKGKYNHIYVTESMGRPYIYYLFYTGTKPMEFRKSAVVARDAFGFVDVKGFNKYVFVKDMSEIKDKKNNLFIDLSSNTPKSSKVLEKFKLLNGEDMLTAYTY